MKQIIKIWSAFKVPFAVAVTIAVSLVLQYFTEYKGISTAVAVLGIAIGSVELVVDTVRSLIKRNFALDYIAILAISVGVISGEYLVALVIVLMLTGGNTLEEWGINRARSALTKLKNRIPDEVQLFENGVASGKIRVKDIAVGQELLVRRGEVIPVDGQLLSEAATIDQSSITGESYEVELFKGAEVRSGTLNTGDPIVVKALKEDQDSTYAKIIRLVENAESEKSPFIRLADRYSAIFTVMTLVIAGTSYLVTQDVERVLSVLVIATPCPLILATPIALMGGVNAAARRKIIIKNLSAIEVAARVDQLVLDKTGTLTLGRPEVREIELLQGAENLTESGVLSISEALERSSLHPLAKSIIRKAREKDVPQKQAKSVSERIGAGISGVVDGIGYTLSKLSGNEGMAVVLRRGEIELAIIRFEDEIKHDLDAVLGRISTKGIAMQIFTGDRSEAAERLTGKLSTPIEFKANCSPEDKLNGIHSLQEKGRVVGMVGDGVNDAPALAKSDVGMVFTSEDQTAATEAADIVLLQGGMQAVADTLAISKRAVRIALQSIKFGIGLSTLGMIMASFGWIPAIVGAFIQEGIDVAVTLNAIRSSRYKDES